MSWEVPKSWSNAIFTAQAKKEKKTDSEEEEKLKQFLFLRKKVFPLFSFLSFFFQRISLVGLLHLFCALFDRR